MKVKHRLPSGNTIDVDLVDFRGTPIEVGSTIVYVIGQNSGKKLVEAKVEQLIPIDSPTSYQIRTVRQLDDKLTKEGFNPDLFDQMKKCLAMAYKTKVIREGEKFDYKTRQFTPKPVRATLPDSSRLVVIK